MHTQYHRKRKIPLHPTHKKSVFGRGFTLIELLVVIAIIALLASMVISTVSSSRAKAQDANVSTELHTIKIALEEYNTAHGGFPNPQGSDKSTSNMYCIGSTECVFSGYYVDTQLKGTDIAFHKPNSNLLASSFPVYSNESIPKLDDENIGFIYIACGGSEDTCRNNTSLLMYPKILDQSFSVMNVGSFENVTCEISQCQENYGHNCGNGTQNCSDFSSTEGACNYDANGTGTSSGNCICGDGTQDCANYCSSTTNNNGCSYDANGTGTCDCSSLSCKGTPTCGGNSYTCGNVSGCSWGGGTSDYCSGSPTCGGNSSTCTNVSGCSWGGATPDYCRGTPTCGGDSYTCGNVSGCSWGGGTSDYCSGSPNISCTGDELTCGSTTGCAWDYYYSSCYAISCGSYSSSYDCSSVSGCSWGGGTPDSCSGTPTDSCGGDISTCGNKSGCSWGGGTPDSCSGTPVDYCSGDSSTCGSKSGCSWGGAMPDYCSGTPTDSCSGDSSTCGDKSGCSWS